MHRHHSAGLQNPVQLFGDKVEMFKELSVCLAVPQIPVTVGVRVQR
jgi:thermostable 8-oxoguanine DNA glycosylase